MAVGTGDILTYCAAMEPLDPTDLMDLYWAGRATLVRKRDDIAVYDEVFRRFFLGGADPVRELITLKARVEAEAEAMLAAPATSPDPEESGASGKRRSWAGWPRTWRRSGASRSRPARPRSWPRCGGS